MGASATFLVAGLVLGVFLIALVSIVGGFLHCRRERVLIHRERIKALEVGREMPEHAAAARINAVFGNSSTVDTESGEGSLARKCYSTALWVAFWGFLAAGQGGSRHQAIAIAIALSVGVIGVAAMICGTVLAFQARSSSAPRSVFKPAIEADEFDVVSCRG